MHVFDAGRGQGLLHRLALGEPEAEITTLQDVGIYHVEDGVYLRRGELAKRP